ncbi:hypothetical protein ACWEIJ_20305 [Lentzea sp. NPDC004789]
MPSDVAGPPLELSSAHGEWMRRLGELPGERLREQVNHIVRSASELGIWERGGYVPLHPFIVSNAAEERFHDVGQRLKQLQIDHALSSADGDLHRLADAAEWPEDERWFLGTGRPLADALGAARSDVFVSGGRPYFLEINIGTCLNGAVSSSALSDALVGSPVGVEMAGTHDLRSSSYLDELVRWVRERCPGESPEVALLAFADQGDEGALTWADEHATRFAAHGIPCEFVPVDEAEIIGNTLVWRGKRYGVAIRYFMVRPEVAAHLDFFRALEHATGTVLLGSYVAQLFASKGLLADLYQNDRLTTAQRDLLTHVPWIARLKNSHARKGDDVVDPVEWAANNRERAVLKPNNLSGSRGLVIGDLTPESGWLDAVHKAVGDGDYVVQELVRPDSWAAAYWHTESETLMTVESPVLLGPFGINGTDGGCYAQQPIKGTEADLIGRDRLVSVGCMMSAP